MKMFVIQLALFFSISSGLRAQKIDIGDASIIVSPNIKSPVRKTLVDILKEEAGNRTSLEWQQARKWNGESSAIIAIALSGDKKLYGKPVPQRSENNHPEYNPEGYRVLTEVKPGQNIIWIIGADARATVFGVGHLLRNAIMLDKQAYLKEPVDVATSPDQSIRGHQLGYRNTANSYDAWDVKQYDQYIRELVLCGMGDALVRTDGERLEPVLYNKGIGEFKEFVIPKHITRDGKMRLTFDRPEESHLNWKQFSHVSDVWLIKR